MNMIEKKQLNTFSYPHGFSLIEVIVTVAILGILSAIAIPSYESYVLTARRADAKAILLETSQYMERYFSTNNTYEGATLLTEVAPKGAGRSDVKYNVSFSVEPSSSVYTLQAVPTSGQDKDKCGTLTISSTGATSPTTDGCW